MACPVFETSPYLHHNLIECIISFISAFPNTSLKLLILNTESKLQSSLEKISTRQFPQYDLWTSSLYSSSLSALLYIYCLFSIFFLLNSLLGIYFSCLHVEGENPLKLLAYTFIKMSQYGQLCLMSAMGEHN